MPKQNNNNLQKQNNNEYEEEYEFIEVNAATGDQYRKFAKIRSVGGQITSEVVNKFHDESVKEAQRWRLDNPGVRSITFRDIWDENGNQVIKLLPAELIFPSGYRVKVFDVNGNEIFGEENIRREIEKREAEWEEWEREGKLQIVDHQTHDFDDGSTATIYFRIPPVKRHKNETDLAASQFEHVGKRLKQQESERNNKLSENDMNIDHQPENSTNKGQESSPTKTNFKFLTREELERLSNDELKDYVDFANLVLEEQKRREREGNSSDFQGLSTQKLEEKTSEAERILNSFQVSNSAANNNDKGSNVGVVIGTVGAVSSFIIGGVVFLKRKLGKSNKK